MKINQKPLKKVASVPPKLNGTLATFFGCFGEFFRKETVIKETNSLQEFQDLLQSKKHCRTKNGSISCPTNAKCSIIMFIKNLQETDVFF